MDLMVIFKLSLIFTISTPEVYKFRNIRNKKVHVLAGYIFLLHFYIVGIVVSIQDLHYETKLRVNHVAGTVITNRSI
jgi:hypothetical protein